MKIRTMGAELFHADGRTDGQSGVTKLTVAFRILRKRPKIEHKAPVNLINKGNNKQLFGHYKSPKKYTGYFSFTEYAFQSIVYFVSTRFA